MAMAADKPLRVAIFGTGFISTYHIDGLKAAGGCEIAALVGRDAEKTRNRAAQSGIARAETDAAKVLADPSIDAVVIATPDATHLPLALASLQAGKSVLLQKPMALSSSECSQILAAASRSRGRLSVSFMHRYFAEVQWLKTLLESKALGKVHTVRIRNATAGADWAAWFYQQGTVSGGVVMQLGVHGIDLIHHLLGPVSSISARAMIARPCRTLVDGSTITSALEDNVLAHYETASGTLVSHEMSYTEIAGCDRFRLELYAEKGTVWLRTERGGAAIFVPEVTGREEWVTPELPEQPLGRDHHAHWIAVASGRADPDGTGEAGLTSISVAESIYRAAKSGTSVLNSGFEGAN